MSQPEPVQAGFVPHSTFRAVAHPTFGEATSPFLVVLTYTVVCRRNHALLIVISTCADSDFRFLKFTLLYFTVQRHAWYVAHESELSLSHFGMQT